MTDLFSRTASTKAHKESYTAEDIEVLEGLEPVRRRPGMYIGGIDENALHHLVSEVLDNAMDEAVAGYATRINIIMHANGSITIEDNGRGIPVDPHPKFPDKSALEIIMTTLHSGGKFSNKSYQTAGGLHGVGISVVNALSENLVVEVIRNKTLYRQRYSRGAPQTTLEVVGECSNKKGTSLTFHHDSEIFGHELRLRPSKIYTLAKSKAYLYRGVEIRWACDPLILPADIPEQDVIKFPNGIVDYLLSKLNPAALITSTIFSGEVSIQSEKARIECAIGWHEDEGFFQSYCNTIPTPLGGTHEQGLRNALVKSIKSYAEMVGYKKAQNIIIDDILENACVMLSVFIPDPLFQGQTKEKLLSGGITKLVETSVKDRFDHWLSADKTSASKLLDYVTMIADERMSRKLEKTVSRKTVVQKLRLPGKLADCTRDSREGTELFIVEGDSAGGSAKQARHRETQAVLPIRGKILNVANASFDKISHNQAINDLEIALSCGSGKHYNNDNLRYEKIIIMTDADVDGAHIAALLMTFFYIRMPKLITNGHLYIAQPPLYRLTQGTKSYYAANDAQKDKLIAELSKKSKTKIEMGRFKGLGEMTAPQLKETTMNNDSRILIKITIDDLDSTSKLVDDLMGKQPEKRFQFIYEQALTKMDQISSQLDI